VQGFSPAKCLGRPKGLHYIGVLFFLAIAAPASAAWRRIDTPNFIIVGDVSARELRATAAKFEGFHEALRRVLPSSTTTAPVPTVVIVFPNDAAFLPFKPQYQGKPREGVAGYAAAGRDVNYIAMLSTGEAGERVIFHEYAHMILANAVARVPLWLNEGLAEFYSTFALMNDGRRAQIGRPIPEHVLLLNGSLRVPLGDLLKVDHSSPLYNEGNHASDFYAESWALTHMLLNGQPSRVNELTEYLRRVSAGTSEIQAWNEVLGTQRTDNELRLYLRRPTINTVVIDFTEKFTAVPVTETTLSAADAAAFLASLQVRNLGPEAAAKLLDSALKQDQTSAAANVAMARIDIARRDPASAAKRLLALAPPSDWLFAYEAGTFLTEAAEEDRSLAGPGEVTTRASQLLESVRRTHPDLPNALAQLAAIEILQGTSPPTKAAQDNIARARALSPGRIEFALMQAELFANARDFASARAVIGPLMTPLYPEDVRNSARRLMGGLVDYEQSLSARRARASAPESSASKAGSNTGTPPPNEPSRSIAVPDADAGKPVDLRGQGRFMPDFRRVQAGEQRIEGLLERIDCPPDGGPVRFVVRDPSGVRSLAVPRMADVDFISYRADLTGGVQCGPFKEPMRVYVTVREGPAPARDQVVVAVEFLPKN
jgi:hypothetical protein